MGMRHRVGGFMVWSIDTDDFRGDCYNEEDLNSNGQYMKSYPLIRSIHRTIEEHRPSTQPEDPMDLPNTIPGSSSGVSINFKTKNIISILYLAYFVFTY